MNFADIARRAAKTAVQTFLAVATVEVIVGGDVEALRSAATAAAAGGIAIIHNALLTWASSDA